LYKFEEQKKHSSEDGKEQSRERNRPLSDEERNQRDKDNPMYKPLTPKSHPKKMLAEQQRKHNTEIRGVSAGS
jgi:hypothetical protein